MEDKDKNIAGYIYSNQECNDAHTFLLPMLKKLISATSEGSQGRTKIFDLGCGNGSVANEISRIGYDVTGVDTSEEGISIANAHYPHLSLHRGSAYDDLSAKFGRFHLVYSLEVIEHVFFPRQYAKSVFELCEPGGKAVVSTPFHGYWKNLALALTGTMDRHFTALWDYGHIKFWSEKTLGKLLREAGFSAVKFHRVGRIPSLAKSMLAEAHKPN